ncbi:MAG: tripartite tricarboxylate transporter substrate binding protein [Proteobacteria bacterium]|nr:tripartite tricarboxylate transporter substrate binding protein [Burkholderiales bacterium]
MRFVVPFPPGGGTDGFARVIGAKLTEYFGQPVLIDNRGGAQGSIGTAIGARAAPDGYTLTLAHSGSFVINPHLYRDPGYAPLKDFAAVSNGVSMPFILVVHPSVPARSTKELAAYAKQHPGKLTFGSSSAGPWMAGELFRITTGTDLVHIPYKGGAPATTALLGAEVATMFTVPFAPLPHVKTGKLRALAILGKQRLEALPDVPTAIEEGFPALSDVYEWYGVAVPAATPRATVVMLNGAIVRALNSPDVQKRLSDIGLDPAPSTPEEFARLIRDDYARWGKVVKASGAKVE